MRVRVRVCVCKTGQFSGFFWFFGFVFVFFGFGFGFQTFIYLTLLFYMCIYTEEYISHLSAPDNMPLISVTSSTPQAEHMRQGEARRLYSGVEATLTRLSAHFRQLAFLPDVSFLSLPPPPRLVS